MESQDILEVLVLLKNGEYKSFSSLDELRKLLDGNEDKKNDISAEEEKKVEELFSSSRYSVCTRKILINMAAVILADSEKQYNKPLNIYNIINKISRIANITKQSTSDKLYRAMGVKSWDYKKMIKDYLNNSEKGDCTLERHLMKNAYNPYDKDLISKYFNGGRS